MKYLTFLIPIIIFFTSCKKEKEEIRLFSAIIDNDSISLLGNAQRYIDEKSGNIFGYNYHIFNLESPSLYIEAYDSSLVKNEFYYPLVKAKYAFTDSSTYSSINYRSKDGYLKITKEHDGVLFGIFNFEMINVLDETDTISITNGYFEITLEEYKRYWNN